jgi:hypothetical protein
MLKNGKLENKRSSYFRLILLGILDYAYSGFRQSLKLTAKNPGSWCLEEFQFPDSKLAKAAEEECREILSPHIVHHSYRTFLFGLGLAQYQRLDKHNKLDIEHLYISCLLHDIAFESPDPNICFAIAGAEHAQKLIQKIDVEPPQCKETIGKRIYDAISEHITPGIERLKPDSLAAMVANGSLLDLTGTRLWQLEPSFAKQVDAWWYREHDFKRRVSTCWKRQANVFPKGRVALVEQCSCFSFFLKHGPLR